MAGVFLSFILARADQTALVSWKDFESKELRAERFELLRPATVSIQGMGLKVFYDYDRSHNDRDEALAYGWILDLETRKPVWSMAREMNPPRSGHQKGIGRVDTKLNLPSGKYAIYYYCGLGKGDSYNFSFDEDGENFFEGLKRFFRGKDFYHFNEKDRRRLYFTASAERNLFRPLTSDPLEARAALSRTRPRNSSYSSEDFKLNQPALFTIYAIGEYDLSNKKMGDGGYIQDIRTRRKVWELTKTNSEPAGGADKNLKYYGQVSLPAGDYQLVYYTDDSHTYGDWNAAPPYDPDFWGITLIAGPEERKKIATLERAQEPVIVQFLRAKDNELLSSGFTLAKAMDLHIYSIGEYDHSSDGFVDYGFIENASTGRRLWEMNNGNTEPAGGAGKNRMFDGVVHFPAGDYVVRYVTDGSHSYNDWNSAAPYDQEHWGIVVAGVPGSFDARSVRPFSGDTKAKNVVVQMIGLRDDDEQEQRFRLTKTTNLKIYAIGEGARDDMYDYGWIENNETERTVWEMTWRNTLPAGGASKNRMFDDQVILPPGSYTAHFATDGSHSTADWNAAPPKDPFHWGITISLAQ